MNPQKRAVCCKARRMKRSDLLKKLFAGDSCNGSGDGCVANGIVGDCLVKPDLLVCRPRVHTNRKNNQTKRHASKQTEHLYYYYQINTTSMSVVSVCLE